jgi:hypothetical protein
MNVYIGADMAALFGLACVAGGLGFPQQLSQTLGSVRDVTGDFGVDPYKGKDRSDIKRRVLSQAQ